MAHADYLPESPLNPPERRPRLVGMVLMAKETHSKARRTFFIEQCSEVSSRISSSTRARTV